MTLRGSQTCAVSPWIGRARATALRPLSDLGWGKATFKRAVGAAYGHRCAITASATYPSLEAAHIRPFADGGEHAVSNGLLLRSDVHGLYDRGYISVDPDLRLRVSPQLREHGWNGVEFYQREEVGFRISEPVGTEHKPNRDALAWHFETRFRAA